LVLQHEGIESCFVVAVSGDIVAAHGGNIGNVPFFIYLFIKKP